MHKFVSVCENDKTKRQPCFSCLLKEVIMLNMVKRFFYLYYRLQFKFYTVNRISFKFPSDLENKKKACK